MELYCVTNKCFLKGVKVITKFKTTCKYCGNALINSAGKKFYEEFWESYPLKFLSQFNNWSSVKLKATKNYFAESVVLYQLHLSHIGCHFIAEYMRSFERTPKGDELMYKALKLTTLKAWHDWVLFMCEESQKKESHDCYSSIYQLFVMEEVSHYWLHDEKGKFIERECSIADMMLHILEHNNSDKRIINKHVPIIEDGFKKFFSTTRSFQMKRFFNLNNDQLFIDFKNKWSDYKDALELPYELSNAFLSITKSTIHPNQFSVMPPIEIFPMVGVLRDWTVKSATSSGAFPVKSTSSSSPGSSDISPTIKSKMTMVSDDLFRQMSSASSTPRKEVLTDPRIKIPEKYKHLPFLDIVDDKRALFMIELLDLLIDSKSKKINLIQLKDTLEKKKTIHFNWKDGFFSALVSGDIIWYNDTQQPLTIFVEFHPFYTINELDVGTSNKV